MRASQSQAVAPLVDSGTPDSRTHLEHGEGAQPRRVENRSVLGRVLRTMGPGLMVCFADTDGSCLITAADSGAEWRYKLLLLQVILIPILYFAQELTVRLALVKGKGLCGCLRDAVGPFGAWCVALPLLGDCFLALISEFTVIAETIQVCWNVPLWITASAFLVLMLLLALTGSYHVAEKVGLAAGVLQVLFFATMFMNPINVSQLGGDLVTFPFNKPDYVKLITANIGAVIMPWMLAYQQSATCEKGLAEGHEPAAETLMIERIDTGVGAFLTQAVMLAMLVTVAASPVKPNNIDDVSQLLPIFSDTMGSESRAKILLTLAICGACTVAAIVESLCGAWALEEAMGRTFNRDAARGAGLGQRIWKNLNDRPVFFVAYTATCIVAWFLVVFCPDFADEISGVPTQFINGLLMPPVVFALWYLASYKLPEEFILGPCMKWVLFTLFGMCAAFCFSSIPIALMGD